LGKSKCRNCLPASFPAQRIVAAPQAATAGEAEEAGAQAERRKAWFKVLHPAKL